METEKLFERDAYLRAFTATVLACAPEKGGWGVVLDRTAFYPEGGGQPGDRGTLGGAAVTDTHISDGVVTHLCNAPLAVGASVAGEIDWRRRFDHMQQHSGEHIVSGLICAKKGCSNVGFHLGAESVIIDFDAVLSPEELTEVEAEANRVIWENRARAHRGVPRGRPLRLLRHPCAKCGGDRAHPAHRHEALPLRRAHRAARRAAGV